MDSIDQKLTLFLKKLHDFLTSRQCKTVLISTFFFSLLANAFAYLNLYPQHDALNHMFEFAGTWEISLGRFMLPVYGMFQGQTTTPWLIGILSVLYISLIVYIICDLFDFRAGWQIVVIAAVMSANLCITELASVFLYVLAAYCFSVLLSCIGVYLLMKGSSPFRYFFAVIFFALSLGMYQAEIAFGVTLLALLAIKDLLDGCKIFHWILKYLKIAGTLACAAIVYYVSYKALLFVFHLEAPNTYSNISKITQLSLGELLGTIKDSYAAFFDYFWGQNNFTGIPAAQVGNIIFALIALISMVVYFFGSKHSWMARVFALLILAALPAIVCLVNILMADAKFEFHRMYSLYLVYVLFMYMIDQCTKQHLRYSAIVSTLVVICCGLIVMQNIVFSNQIYSNQKIMYDRAASIVGRVLDDVETMPDYEAGETEVVIIGQLQKNKLLKNLIRIDSELPSDIQKNQGLRKMINYSSLGGAKILSATYTMTFDSFAWLLGSEMYRVSDNDVLQEYGSMEEVANMPVYPKDGYCRMIDGRMVIKLS